MLGLHIIRGSQCSVMAQCVVSWQLVGQSLGKAVTEATKQLHPAAGSTCMQCMVDFQPLASLQLLMSTFHGLEHWLFLFQLTQYRLFLLPTLFVQQGVQQYSHDCLSCCCCFYSVTVDTPTAGRAVDLLVTLLWWLRLWGPCRLHVFTGYNIQPCNMGACLTMRSRLFCMVSSLYHTSLLLNTHNAHVPDSRHRMVVGL